MKIRAEYWLIGGLFLFALLAFPAYRNVHLLQSIVLSFCASIGLIN